MEDYIPYLRRMIGHAKCISVGLTALIVDAQERVVLEKRADNGKYCLPGGSLDLEEKVEDGLRREVLEETGLVLEEVHLFSIESGAKTTFAYPNGDQTNYVDLNFYCPLAAKEPLLRPRDKESTRVFLCSLNALPPAEETMPGTLRILRKYQKKDFAITID